MSEADAIDRALGVTQGDALARLRAIRPEFAEGSETCRRSVLTPDEDLGLSPQLRSAVAMRVLRSGGSDQLLADYTVPPDPDLAALALGDTPRSPRLVALAQHADLIAARPSEAGPEDLGSLSDAGYSVPQIIALSELLAYACYVIRVMCGYALLRTPGTAGPEQHGSTRTAGIPQITLKPLTWTPYLPPVEIAEATPRQLEAMKVTPSEKKVSAYVRTLVHDPESYVARTVLFNAIMYAEGGLNPRSRAACRISTPPWASRFSKRPGDESR